MCSAFFHHMPDSRRFTNHLRMDICIQFLMEWPHLMSPSLFRCLARVNHLQLVIGFQQEMAPLLENRVWQAWATLDNAVDHAGSSWINVVNSPPSSWLPSVHGPQLLKFGGVEERSYACDREEWDTACTLFLQKECSLARVVSLGPPSWLSYQPDGKVQRFSDAIGDRDAQTSCFGPPLDQVFPW